MKLTRRVQGTLTIGCQLIVFLLLLSGLSVLAQSPLPVIKATSKPVDIRDGYHFKKGYWAIMPERKPDLYFVELPQNNHRVSFITDLDSISFDITYGREYDFVILLNGKDSCYTRISARYKNLNASTRKNATTGPDTIPFTLGDNHKVYVNATLNGTAVRDIQLDLGAGGTLINKTSVPKVKIDFDQTTTLTNSAGVNQVPNASTNRLQMGNLVWDSLPIAVAGNMKEHEDLLIGNSLFRDRVLEINYDKRIVVVHDSLPQVTGYSRHEMILDGGTIPYGRVSFLVNGKELTGWVMFDTGARTSIVNSADVPFFYRVWTELLGMLGLETAVAPRLRIGDYELSGFEYKIRDMGAGGKELKMLLGSDLLKRFNLILDNQHGYLYMQPNGLTHDPYRKRDEYYMVRIATTLLLFGIAAIFLFPKIRRKQKKS
ncbi:MAG: retroviral-like aspartic protease family protein [Agriterribacter sp.]